MSVHAALALGLDFSWGSEFQKKVKQRYHSTVHPLGKSDHFLMTVSFGHAKFKLDSDSASLALESCIGGLCDDLAVIQLGERVFRFSVNSRAVGFMVYDLKSFACDSFKCYFHLWGNGGPSWKREFASWQKDCMAEWTIVSPNKKRSDYALRALRKQPSKPALKPRNLDKVSKSLNFATFLSYPACHGYEYQASDAEVDDLLQAGYSCPQLIRRANSVSLPDSLSKIVTDKNIQFGSVGDPSRAVSEISKGATLTGQDPPSPPAINCTAQFSEFNQMIEETADSFWRCQRCLSMHHETLDCTGMIRCKGCYRYGHVKKDCWRVKRTLHWVVKTSPRPDNLGLCAASSSAIKCADLIPTSTVARRSDLSSVSPPQLPLSSSTMANFPVDLHRFVPAGFDVLEPWGADARPARLCITDSTAPPHRHESWAIAQVLPRPEGDEIEHVLNQVHDHIEQDLHWDVASFAESAVGIGLFRMNDSITRDLLVAQPARNLGHGRMLTFARHDEGPNFRSTVYTRLSWIMLLDLNLDYRNEQFLREAFAKFGKMRGWIRDDPETA
jgi:hypothetical protein